MNQNEPEIVWSWKDTETDAEGWVVFDRVINGIAGGGIFMHSNATKEEAADIAANMTKKFTVTLPQIGGAKAGIRFDHTDPRANEVLRRFIHVHSVLLNNVWVTAGDLNTDDAFIEKIIVEELGLTCCQHQLGESVGRVRGHPSLSGQLAKLIEYPANEFAPLIEATVGYGAAEAVKVALEKMKPMKSKKARVMIQGFGAVGSNLALYLTERKIAKVVAIADKDGFIHDSNGLPIRELLEARKNNIESSPEGRLEKQKNCIVNLILEQRQRLNFVPREQFGSNEDFSTAFLSCETAEIFSPCAFRYCITSETVRILERMTWKNLKNRLIISGANNPFGVVQDGRLIEDKSGTVTSLLQQAGAVIVPDWIVNSGTAQLFHRGLSIPFDLDSKDLAEEVLKASAMPIRLFLEDAFRMCERPLDLPSACLRKAQRLINSPIPLNLKDDHFLHLNPSKSIYCLPPASESESLEKRMNLAMSVANFGGECVNPDELSKLLHSCRNPVAYDGFEPSGRMHIAQGLMKMIHVNHLTEAGFTFIFWVADWFAQLNQKMGGDLQKIQDVGRYFIEVWKACGMKMDRVKFLWASEEIDSRSDKYWGMVMTIMRKNTIGRMKKCLQIQGRSEDNFEAGYTSGLLYPAMQCADIFYLGVDVCQLGLDQRKVNMLAREMAPTLNHPKPIILSHGMLPGLMEPKTLDPNADDETKAKIEIENKMSKSNPDSAIFMEDSAKDVERKIRKAWCPEQIIEGNPVIDYFKMIVFQFTDTVTVHRRDLPSLEFHTFEELSTSYQSGEIHPLDLKMTLSWHLNRFIDPVRQHFQNDPHAKALIERIKTYQVTK